MILMDGADQRVAALLPGGREDNGEDHPAVTRDPASTRDTCVEMHCPPVRRGPGAGHGDDGDHVCPPLLAVQRVPRLQLRRARLLVHHEHLETPFYTSYTVKVLIIVYLFLNFLKNIFE